jgi:hypothetical protein
MKLIRSYNSQMNGGYIWTRSFRVFNRNCTVRASTAILEMAAAPAEQEIRDPGRDRSDNVT